MLGFYFSKYRNIAYGFVTTGVGVGVMLFGPLANYLIALYTWRGALLVLSGILANNVVVGALMRPLNSHNQKQYSHEMDNNKGDSLEKKQSADLSYSKTPENCSSNGAKNGRKILSLRNLHKKESIFNEVKTCSLRSGLDLTSSFRDLQSVPTCHLSAECFDPVAIGTELHVKQNEDQCNAQTNQDHDDISLCNSNDVLKDVKANRKKSQRWFLNPSFLAHMFNFISIGIGLPCIYIHFPAYVIELGTSADHASILVSLMGCGNIIGRLGIGAITNM